MEEQKKQPTIAEILSDYDKAVNFFHETPAEVWEAIGQRSALGVFKEMVATIPAYSKFLKSVHFDPESVQTAEDLQKVPVIDKYNYINEYDFNETNIVKAGENLYSISLSSGTTDAPTIWPRYYQYEEFLPLIFDFYMRQYWEIDKKSSLFINAFAMGPWIAGHTVNVLARALTQKRNLTLATCGDNLDSIIYCIQSLSKHYDQTVIWSYPTFCRSILDKIEKAGIDIRKLNLKLFIAGEGHTMEWRRFINKKISGEEHNLTDILDGFGTSDGGMLGFATSLTNLIRGIAQNDKKIRKELFGREDVIPTLFQYNPGSFFIEELDGEIVFTTKSATPLARYNIHDRGGVIGFRKMESILKAHGYDYRKQLADSGLSENMIWQQPFVYCFGRRDDTFIIAGANIFPEQIYPALSDKKATDIHSFKLATTYDKTQHQLFHVLVELKDGISYSPKKMLEKKTIFHDIILKQLLKSSSDYAASYKADPEYADIKIDISSYATGLFKLDHEKTKPKLVVKK